MRRLPLSLRAERVVPLGLRFDGAEKRSRRLDDYRLVSDDAPNGVWGDLVGKAVAAFLYFADRAAHSRHAPEQHVPRATTMSEIRNRLRLNTTV